MQPKNCTTAIGRVSMKPNPTLFVLCINIVIFEVNFVPPFLGLVLEFGLSYLAL